MDPCAGELLLVATRLRRSWRRVWGVPGHGLRRWELRERAGRGQRRRACEAAHWSSRAAGARASKGSRREKEEGDKGVACCGCRGESAGVRGRAEVAGGGWQGAATVRERTVARSRACKWPACHFFGKVGTTKHVW